MPINTKKECSTQNMTFECQLLRLDMIIQSSWATCIYHMYPFFAENLYSDVT